MIDIDVLLFAGVAETVGQRSVRFQVEAGSSVEQVLEQFVQQFPEVKDLALSSRWAAGSSFVERDYTLHQAAELAMIPPVSGG